MDFPMKLFTIKGNSMFMKNVYYKLAIASVCTTLSFALGTNQEAKAATINLKQTYSFYAVDANNDGLGDGTYGNISFIPVGKSPFLYPKWEGVFPEFRALYEFNIASLSLTSNTIITQAIFQTTVDSWFGEVDYFSLGLWGYKGNGQSDNSDFEAGTYLNSPQQPISEPPDFNFNLLNIDVTPIVNELVSNNDAFAGFNIRAYYDKSSNVTYGSGNLSGDASLIITTAEVAEPVPEPTTIFGSALALSLGGWLKRKKLSQQNKTAPRR
jgi:hypothetical protein